MSDTTPRPDEPREDALAPAPDVVPEPQAVPQDSPPPPPAGAEEAPAFAAQEQGYPQPDSPQQPYPPSSLPVPAYPSGQAPISPQEERTWGMVSHIVGAVAMVASAGLLGFVGSLVIYLVYKDRGPFVRAHSANSLNVQITAGIGFIIGWVLTITIIGALIGIPLLIAVFIWAVVVHVMGAIKANNGEWWQPPLTPKFVS